MAVKYEITTKRYSPFEDTKMREAVLAVLSSISFEDHVHILIETVEPGNPSSPGSGNPDASRRVIR